MSESIFVDDFDTQSRVVAQFFLDGRDGLRDLLIDAGHVVHRRLPLLLDIFDGSLGKRLVAPDTGFFFSRRLLLAARTDDGPDIIRLVGLDVEGVGAGNLSFVRIVEHSNVPGSDVRPADPDVVFLEVNLRDTLAGEIACRGLAEVGRRDRRPVFPSRITWRP